MNHFIRVSDQALEDMVLAASEAKVLGDGDRKKHKGVETYGHLWGSRRRDVDNGQEHIYIEKFSMSLSAVGTHKQVRYDENALHLKASILERWSPRLMFLGDFHTHPHGSLEKIKAVKGWDFSDEDVKSFLKDESLWNHSQPMPPIMTVMAVTPLKKVHETYGVLEENNRWRFDTGQLRFWLSVGIGCRTEDGRGFSIDSVYLDLQPRLYNSSGDRLSGFRRK